MEVSHIDLERMIRDRKSIVSTLQARSLRFYFETIRSLSLPLHLSPSISISSVNLCQKPFLSSPLSSPFL